MVYAPPIRFKPVMAIFLLAFSCSIIEDGDITSTEELQSLKLTSFEISQNTNSGSSSVTATLNYDSVQNFTDVNTNTKITRKVEYTLPPLGTLKMKLRSGATGATKVYIYYTDTKKPYTLGIVSQDSVVELYRFRYSSTGQLNRIATFIDPIDNLPLTVATNDSLIYSGNQLNTFSRRSNGSTTNYQVGYNTVGNNSTQVVSNLSTGNTGGGGNGDAFSNGNCDHSPTRTCYTINCGTCNINTQLSVSVTEISGTLLQLELVNWTNVGGPYRDGETFYFHPLMMLRNQLSFGNHLLNIYLIDWCKVNLTTLKPISSVETVTFNYTNSH